MVHQYEKPYQLCERTLPRCGDDDLLVEVYAAGFCHSDLQVWNGQFPANLPMIPSHEPAGKIVQVGANVPGSWKVGDRVGVLNYKNACGKCAGCRQHARRAKRPDPRFCQNRIVAGFRHDGAFADYMLADPNTTVHLPDGVSFEQGAPLMCAGVGPSLSDNMRYLANSIEGDGMGRVAKAQPPGSARRYRSRGGYWRSWATWDPIRQSPWIPNHSHGQPR
jgi:D-arabinose 1-dehydrogenase-like Zn-dependent alcohol dehydrogenase